jgi:hypothetical protein
MRSDDNVGRREDDPSDFDSLSPMNQQRRRTTKRRYRNRTLHGVYHRDWDRQTSFPLNTSTGQPSPFRPISNGKSLWTASRPGSSTNRPETTTPCRISIRSWKPPVSTTSTKSCCSAAQTACNSLRHQLDLLRLLGSHASPASFLTSQKRWRPQP